MTPYGPHGPVPAPPQPAFPGGPDWYRDAIVYEVHIRAFQDSNGDGIGDFDGLTSRLDYLQDLGVTAIWLLPFYPSPLRDDGYDIADYRGINPDYGDLRSFKRMLREAHRRGLRVITELVINHTSDAHAWFQRARAAEPGSRWRDFYVWSDTPDRYLDARVIFHDFESSNWTWDPVAGAYFWHRFYSHQPDLNYDNPDVHQAVLDALDFWLNLGVDGLRLDAVPYLYERDGTNCENLPETHQFLRRLRRHVDEKFPGRMLLAEANQWPEDAVAYFGDDTERECHMAFHFPLMPRMFMAVQMEDRFPVVDILEQTPELPDGGQWAIFLRNHDELTLEMVSAEERDYMYRVYAHDPQMRVNAGIRRRLAPLLGNDRRKIELLNGLLLALPGTPVIYYGDEIGMGDNVYLGDRDAVRTPMQWAPDRNGGFSTSNPHKLYLPAVIDPEFHYGMVNVEVQQAHENSLFRWMRQVLHLRSRHPVFGRGSLRMLLPDNPRIVAFVRSHEDEHVLVVANLAGSAQYAELDLSDHAGARPVELFGHTDFPPVGELPYLVTLGPYAFHWFALTRQETDAPVQGVGTGPVPTVRVECAWSEVLEGPTRAALNRVLPEHLATRRWFPGKGRAIADAQIVDVVRLTPKDAAQPAHLALVRVRFREGEPATFALPLAVVGGERAEMLLAELSHGVVASLRNADGETRVLSEAMWEPSACQALLERSAVRRSRSGEKGELIGSPTTGFRKVADGLAGLDAQALRAEQSNTSVVFGDQAVLKLFRRLEPGVNPDLELSRFLTDHEFPHVPRLLGALEYRTDRRPPMTVALVHEHVANEGDLWQHSLDALHRFYRETFDEHPVEAADPSGHLLDHLDDDVPDVAAHANGAYLELCSLLGTRTAQLHRALAAPTDDPAFGVEDLSALDQRALHQAMRSSASRTFTMLRKRFGDLSEALVEPAAAVLAHEPALLERFEPLRSDRLGGQRIRVHGDYHLGQVLFTGRDLVVLDFEGEPLQSISERRLRRSPLRDVAGMLRSFHYATLVALRVEEERGLLTGGTEPAERAAAWARAWYGWAAGRFLGAYLREAADAAFLPSDPASLRVLLDAFVLEKAVYELSYELSNRPDWCWIPLEGLLHALGADRDVP